MDGGPLLAEGERQSQLGLLVDRRPVAVAEPQHAREQVEVAFVPGERVARGTQHTQRYERERSEAGPAHCQ